MKTLLIVDDEKATRDGLRMALEESFDCYVAADLKQAKQVLNSEDVDLLLTDLRLGADSGIEVLDAEGNLLDQTNFSNYRLIDGIPVAFNIKNIKKGKTVSQSTWSEVTINSAIYDFLFEKPKFLFF